jgi:hypothetical protein
MGVVIRRFDGNPMRYCPARRAQVALLVIAVSSCGGPVEPLRHAGAPEVLEFTFGGFAVETRAWRLVADTFVYEVRAWDVPNGVIESTRTVPAAEDWQRFWQAAAEAGVPRWRGAYAAPDILDGAGWQLTLASGEGRVEAHGSNAYPDRNGRKQEGAMTAEFQRFLSALEMLIGR